MSTSTVRSFSHAILAGVVLALLAGCGVASPGGGPIGEAPETPRSSTETNPPASGPEPNTGDPTQDVVPARLELTGQSFTFTVTCMIAEDDLLIFGPGRDDDSGEPAYLSVDIPTVGGQKRGEIRIDLGTDQEFVSSDDVYRSPVNPEVEYTYTSPAGQTVIVSRYTAQSPIGPGKLTAECD